MTNYKEIAKKYLSLDLNPISITQGTKNPDKGFTQFTKEKTTEEKINVFDFKAIAISTGYISKNLEVIDLDIYKSKDKKSFIKDFKSRLPKKLLKKLVIQKTSSGGYHLMYRCLNISASKHLARNADGQAIIETRGEGGYVIVSPSYGYEIVQGSLENIPYITEEERFELFLESQKLDQCIIKDTKKRFSKSELIAFNKFPTYNNDPQIAIELLEKHGWKKLNREDPQWISFTRPNTKSGDNHAGYHKEGLFLNVFSTSQSTFETGRPYNNHAIYAELEHEGNYPKAYAKLYEMGYGVDIEELPEEESEKKEWKSDVETLSFLSDELEENKYLDQARLNNIPQGLTWGFRELDKYFRAKPNSLNMGIGYDNIGKSIFTLTMAQSTNILHGWRWGMMMPENRNQLNRRRLIEVETGRDITYFKDKPDLLKKYIDRSRDNFKIIANKKHYTVKEVIEIGRKLYEIYGINALLVDPYNFFKVTSPNSHAHNNEILSELRVFTEKYCSVYLIGHPGTQASRQPNNNEGFKKAPSKYDVQGGADFPYRVDDFFIMHRIINHPERSVRTQMQIKMEKIKERETGGNVHVDGDYTALTYETREGFRGYFDENGDNPMYRAKVAKLDVSKELVQIKKMKPEDVF